MNREVKALLRQDFLSFARKGIMQVDGTKIGSECYLRYLADELDEFAKGNTRRLIVNLPPGHLKSLLGSVCLSAWMLAANPTLKIMLVTHTEILSKSIARRIRSIVESDWYAELFGIRVKKGHGQVTDFGTTAGGRVVSVSFGSNITGLRADVILIDDPHDIDDPYEQIERTVESFNRTVMSRLNDRKSGRVLVIAHRVHDRDLSARLLGKKKWKHLVLPLLAVRDQSYQTASGEWHRRQGEFLRPDVFGQQVVEELRDTRLGPDFEMLYQQDCDGMALRSITVDHFPMIKELMPRNSPVVLS